jgi:twitching motility two-component system response regulator PilG
MNRVSSHPVANSQNPYPVDLLAELSSTEAVGCLRVFQNSSRSSTPRETVPSVTAGELEGKSTRHQTFDRGDFKETQLPNPSSHLENRQDKDSLTYSIYLEEGKLVYLTNSIAPYERLERHLRRLSHKNKTISNTVRTQIRQNFFEGDFIRENRIRPLPNALAANELHSSKVLHGNGSKHPNNVEADNTSTSRVDFSDSLADYRAICWLVKQEYLSRSEAELLIDRINHEVLESFLLLGQDFHFYIERDLKVEPILYRKDLSALLGECKQNIRNWQALAPQISSSYQRPYLFVKSDSAPQLQKLGNLLKGFSFRQLSALLDRDELFLAKQLHPLIVKKVVILREPQPPFTRLPKISASAMSALKYAERSESETEQWQNLSSISNRVIQPKHWKIVCIDDSQTMLNEISRFLEREDFSVMTINEPLKALMKIISFRPNLILLDVGMPNIDGYKLCSLIRKYSAFRDTPIVMVTGNKGLIDRARAKLAGATDYMTKPFTQFDLLTMVFRYLT